MSVLKKTVQYRILDHEISGLGEATNLATAIKQAMEANINNGELLGESPRARIADLDQSGQMILLNHIYAETRASFAGQLIMYREGHDVPALLMQESEQQYFQIRHFQTDEVSKPIEGVLYFVVINNHVGVIPSKTVGCKWLERYLTWLLKDKTNIITNPECFIGLQANLKLDTDKISELTGKKATINIQQNTNQGAVADRITHEETIEEATTIIKILQLLGISDQTITNLKTSIPSGGELKGDLQVYIKNKNQFQTFPITNLLQDIESDALIVESRGKKIINGLVRLSQLIDLQAQGSWLVPEDVITKITQQMQRWADEGHIVLNM